MGKDEVVDPTTPKDGPEEEAPIVKDCPFPVKCCTSETFRLAHDDATGFLCFRFANGAVIMSNVFLSGALIYLAEQSAGCIDMEDGETCLEKVYGFRPSSLITIIGTISGLMSAFLLPIIGAVVDYTEHRRRLGAVSAFMLITIQVIQIGSTKQTWFFMAILQAINGFIYQALTLAAYAYLPEVNEAVGESKMVEYSATFYSWMFGCQVGYLILVFAMSYGIGSRTDAIPSDVLPATIGQSIDAVFSGFFYYLGFYFFTHKGPRRQLEKGSNLVSAGFRQVFSTASGVFKHYPKTLGRFFIGVAFGEAAANSFTVVSVTFLSELGFGTSMIGMIYVLVLTCCVIGTFFAKWVMKATGSPIRSMMYCLVAFMAVNFAAFLTITRNDIIVWPSVIAWGFMLGWFYPTELQCYSSLMPKSQEAELAGFFLYCTQILVWIPPLVFTIFNETPSIDLSWGGVQLNIWLLLSLIFYAMLPSWEECREITMAENKMVDRSSVITDDKDTNA